MTASLIAILDGKPWFIGPYRQDDVWALAMGIKENMPRLAALYRRVVFVAECEGVAHIVARSNPYAREGARS